MQLTVGIDTDNQAPQRFGFREAAEALELKNDRQIGKFRENNGNQVGHGVM
jgi:hypothetical protein